MEINEWLNDNQLSIDIWNNKYRNGEETFEEWLDRVSNHNKDIKKLIKDKKFLFGGRTLANRNVKKAGSYSNCYSIGFVPDSLEGIMDTANKIALTFKAQGGQGLSLSKIRPKGTKIGEYFESDGIVPFMHIFNTVTESISQGGSRKGALMMSIDIWHKEAPTFITIKQDSKEINKANLSVEIDDDFMKTLEDYNRGKSNGIINITKTYEDKTITYDVNVPEVYNLICESAWKSAEPGIIFTNRFRNYNIMELDPNYCIETCNPCGEQPLPKHGACNLSSINLSEYVLNPYTSSAKIDYFSLTNDIQTIVNAMDMVLEENAERHALKEQKEMALKYRNIGIGIMGLADMFVKMGIKYGSSDSIGLTKIIMITIFRFSVFSSAARAKHYGNFPGYSDVVWDSQIMKNAFNEEELNALKKEGFLRNCSLLSVAPTGSIGTMLNISTGVEPFFALSYTRTTKSLNKETDKDYKVEVKAVKDYRKITGNQGELPDYFITSAEINYKDRIAIQAALQEFTDTAISSTVNLPRETTIDDVKDLYLQAWKAGLKGITIFVEGSRDPILSTEKKEGKTEENTIPYLTTNNQLDYIEAKSRDTFGKALIGKTYKYTTACGTLYITINRDAKGNIVEIFTNSSKNGTCKANLNGETRLASLALRSGVKVSEVIDSLKAIQCQSCAFARAKGNKIDGSSCPDIIAKCIKQEYENKKEYIQPEIKVIPEEILAKKIENDTITDICPECGQPLQHIGGCISCMCGFSRCG